MSKNRNTPNREQDGKFSSEQQRSQNRSDSNQKSGMGRGWHGDSEGHARAGAQSNKNK